MPGKRLALLFFLLAILGLATLVLAQSSADFDLSWHIVASGGGRSESTDYLVQGTVGQAVTGPPEALSADYRLHSGFWYPAEYKIYLPLASRR